MFEERKDRCMYGRMISYEESRVDALSNEALSHFRLATIPATGIESDNTSPTTTPLHPTALAHTTNSVTEYGTRTLRMERKKKHI